MKARWIRPGARGSDAPPRTASLRQIHETECGVIALAIVLAHYGAWVRLPELRLRCQVSEQGVTGLSLVQAARHYGLTIRAIRLAADNLRHIPAPAVLFWENQHFIVLEGIRGDVAWVNDPARGHRRISLATLGKGYSGVALLAKPAQEFRSIGSPRQPFRTAVDTLRPGRWWLALMAAAALAESVLLPLVVLLVGDAIRDTWNEKTADWRSVALALTALLVASASRLWLTGRALNAIAGPARRLVTAHLADPLSHNRLPQPVALLGQHQLADYPATTTVRMVTAGIRMTVAVPLLVLILGRVHPVAALVALVALATPLLIQRQIPRAAAEAQPPYVRAGGSMRQHLRTRWPILRPFVELSPVIIAGVLTATDTLSATIVALLASWCAFRLVDSAVQATGMLDLLPESIVQLSDIDRKWRVVQQSE